MSPSYLRLFPVDTRNLTFSDPNKLILLFLKVANLCDDFEQRTAAFTPTLSSPRPRAGAAVGRFMKALLSALVTGPQDTTLNVNPLPASLAAPNDVAHVRLFSSPLLFKHYTHPEIGSFHASIPSFSIAGLFKGFIAIPNFETFNILVIFGLLYLFFTPPVSGSLRILFPHNLTTTIRLKTAPLRTTYSASRTPMFLMTLSRMVPRSPAAPATIRQQARSARLDLERSGLPAV